MRRRGSLDSRPRQSAYTGVNATAPPNSYRASPAALAAAGAVANLSSSRTSSNLSSAAAATALRRYSLTGSSADDYGPGGAHDSSAKAGTPRVLARSNSTASASRGLNRSNSIQSVQSTRSNRPRQSVTVTKTRNPDRTMSLTRRTVSQYGSFELIKEDTEVIRPKPRPQQPRPYASSVLSYDSDLPPVSEEGSSPTSASVRGRKPRFTETHLTVKKEPPVRGASPIKSALKDSSRTASFASSDEHASSTRRHTRVSFSEEDDPAITFAQFSSHPSPSSVAHASPAQTAGAKTSAARTAFTKAAATPASSSRLSVAALAGAQGAKGASKGSPKARSRRPGPAAAAAGGGSLAALVGANVGTSSADAQSDSGDSIYSDASEVPHSSIAGVLGTGASAAAAKATQARKAEIAPKKTGGLFSKSSFRTNNPAPAKELNSVEKLQIKKEESKAEVKARKKAEVKAEKDRKKEEQKEEKLREKNRRKAKEILEGEPAEIAEVKAEVQTEAGQLEVLKPLNDAEVPTVTTASPALSAAPVSTQGDVEKLDAVSGKEIEPVEGHAGAATGVIAATATGAVASVPESDDLAETAELDHGDLHDATSEPVSAVPMLDEPEYPANGLHPVSELGDADEESDDSTEWHRHRQERKSARSNGFGFTSLRNGSNRNEDRPVAAEKPANSGLPTPASPGALDFDPSDSNLLAEIEDELHLEPIPSDSSFKRERSNKEGARFAVKSFRNTNLNGGHAADGPVRTLRSKASSDLRPATSPTSGQGFRLLSLRDNAPRPELSSSKGTAPSNGGGSDAAAGFKSRFDDSSDSEPERMVASLRDPGSYDPVVSHKSSGSGGGGGLKAVFSPTREAKFLIPKKGGATPQSKPPAKKATVRVAPRLTEVISAPDFKDEEYRPKKFKGLRKLFRLDHQ